MPPREHLWADNDQAAVTFYLPAEDTPEPRTAIVICPGGGYSRLAMGHEGADTAAWLNRLGCVAVVLEYRMSREGCQHPIPLQDAQRAVRLVRSRAESLNLRSDAIGILGYSAGGHLAATVGTHLDSGDPDAVDPVDRESARPDFMLLCYPVIVFGESFTHSNSQRNLLGEAPAPELIEHLSCEKQVSPQTPPTFLFHTDADPLVSAEHSVAFYLALRKAGIPAEMHIYQNGRHGLGLAGEEPGTSEWPKACEQWLRVRNLLPPSA